jgi:hypothetical protein
MHRTGAALPVIATLLRSGEDYGLTDAIEQRRPWVDAEFAILAVDAQGDRDRPLDVWLVHTCLGWSVGLRRSGPNDDGCRSSSGGLKKCPAIWI